MPIYCLQHVPFEGPAFIGRWAQTQARILSPVALYAGQALPDREDIDGLIVMGGPMGVRDEDRYPWLEPEKALIAETIALRRPVLGICLGAQLIAAVLGAKVYPNAAKEIGWFPVTRTPAAAGHRLGRHLPERFTAFHWHGDTFDLPKGAVHLAQSAACRHQAFAFGQNVLALQFHLESDAQSVAALVDHCAEELQPGPSIQPAARIREGVPQAAATHPVMAALLAALFQAPAA
jgi:GMP synthase-like glutamine amidotransferase